MRRPRPLVQILQRVRPDWIGKDRWYQTCKKKRFKSFQTFRGWKKTFRWNMKLRTNGLVKSISMTSEQYKRVILVTGSNTGIGLEIVRILAEKGHTVYLSARNERAGQDSVSDIGLPTVRFVQLDVTSPSSIQAARDTIEKAEGRLDALVNNAGIGGFERSVGALAEPIDHIQNALDINFLGVVAVCQAFVPLLRKAQPGYASIVTVTTDMASNGLMASPKGYLHVAVAYNTSKAAANSYMIALAKELEGEVKVNAVTPGFTTSKLNGFKEGGKTPRESAETIVPWVLLGPEDKDKTCLCWGSDGPFPW